MLSIDLFSRIGSYLGAAEANTMYKEFSLYAAGCKDYTGAFELCSSISTRDEFSAALAGISKEALRNIIKIPSFSDEAEVDEALEVAKQIPHLVESISATMIIFRKTLESVSLAKALEIESTVPRETRYQPLLKIMSNALISIDIESAIRIALSMPIFEYERNSDVSGDNPKNFARDHAIGACFHEILNKGDVSRAWDLLLDMRSNSIQAEHLSQLKPQEMKLLIEAEEAKGLPITFAYAIEFMPPSPTKDIAYITHGQRLIKSYLQTPDSSDTLLDRAIDLFKKIECSNFNRELFNISNQVLKKFGSRRSNKISALISDSHFKDLISLRDDSISKAQEREYEVATELAHRITDIALKDLVFETIERIKRVLH
jgi:hypothetical protein